MPRKTKTDLSKRSRRSRKLRLSNEQLEKQRLQARLYYMKCKEKAAQEGRKLNRQHMTKHTLNNVYESKEKRKQRLKKLSEAKAMMRAQETEEARQKRLKNGREQSMLRRLSESQEERNFRLAKERVRKAYLRYMNSKCNLNY